MLYFYLLCLISTKSNFAKHLFCLPFKNNLENFDISIIKKFSWRILSRCPWCNGYRRRNWRWQDEFKSWTDCISHSTNTLGKGMNPIILSPAMGKE